MEATQVSTGGSPGTHVGHCPRTNLHGREDGGTGRLLLARWIVSSLCLRFQLCLLVATMAQLSQPESLPALTLSLSAIDLSVCAALPPPPISSQPCGSEVTDQATGAWGGELGAPGGASWGPLGGRAGGPWLIGIHAPSLHCLFGAELIKISKVLSAVSAQFPRVCLPSPTLLCRASAGPPETPSQGSPCSARCVPGRSGEPRSASLASHGSAASWLCDLGRSLCLSASFSYL